MSATPATKVFVSYSHADSPLVGPVVQLLRANRSLVFQDVDSIRPGKRWRGEIEQALAGSGLVVLFWCGHASKSDEVAKEWQAALDQGKDVLPLLLDATPLPEPLSEFQWIDFRATVGPGHGALAALPVQAPAPSAPGLPKSGRPIRWIALASVAAVLVGAVGLSALVGMFRSPEFSMPGPGNHPPIPTPGSSAGGALFAALIVLAFLVALAGIVIRHRRAARRPAPAAPAEPAVGEVERHIASEVEAEILRRTAPSH